MHLMKLPKMNRHYCYRSFCHGLTSFAHWQKKGSNWKQNSFVYYNVNGKAHTIQVYGLPGHLSSLYSQVAYISQEGSTFINHVDE